MNSQEFRPSFINMYEAYSFLLTLIAAQWKKLHKCNSSLRQWGKAVFCSLLQALFDLYLNFIASILVIRLLLVMTFPFLWIRKHCSVVMGLGPRSCTHNRLLELSPPHGPTCGWTCLDSALLRDQKCGGWWIVRLQAGQWLPVWPSAGVLAFLGTGLLAARMRGIDHTEGLTALFQFSHSLCP